MSWVLAGNINIWSSGWFRTRSIPPFRYPFQLFLPTCSCSRSDIPPLTATILIVHFDPSFFGSHLRLNRRNNLNMGNDTVSIRINRTFFGFCSLVSLLLSCDTLNKKKRRFLLRGRPCYWVVMSYHWV